MYAPPMDCTSSNEQLELECIEYETIKNRPIIHFFGRDSKGNRVLKKFTYRPYFFIREQDIRLPSLQEIKGVLEVQRGYLSIFGEPLVKVIMNLPYNVGLAKDYLHSHGIPTYECLASFATRWMIDNRVTYLYPSLDNTFPSQVRAEEDRTKLFLMDLEAVDNQIIMISYAVSPDYSINTLFWRPEEKDGEKRILLEFIDSFLAMDPDVIAGWNIAYDLRMLYNRAKSHRLPIRKLSPMGSITFSNKSLEEEVIIKGREVFDYARAYKKLYKKELNLPIVEALDTVAKRHLGYGKLPIEPEELPRLWREDISTLLEYNRRDVQLLLDLERKLNIFKFFNWLRKMVGVRLRDVWYDSRLIDSGLLRITDRKLPSAGAFPKESRMYMGGLREAHPGIYDNVMFIDFRSFYPSIIIKHNISIETYGKNTGHEGIVPSLLRRLLALKDKAKEEYKKNPTLENELVYKTLKYLVNTGYGQFGYKNSRLYDIDCAEAVTTEARKEIKNLRSLLEKMGIKVCYLDTDGLGFPYHSEKEKREELVSILNDNLQGLQVEEAEFYKRIIILAKTRYIGRNEKDEIIAKGISLIRSDTPPYFAETQKKLCEMVLFGEKKENILSFLKESIEKLEEQSLWNLGVPKGIRKTFEEYKVNSHHIKAIKTSSSELGIRFKPGDKPRILPKKGGGFIAINSKTVYPKEKIDYQKLRTALLQVLRPVYSKLGITDEDILGIPKQSSIVTFLGTSS